MNSECRKQFVALHSRPVLDRLSEGMLHEYGVTERLVRVGGHGEVSGGGGHGEVSGGGGHGEVREGGGGVIERLVRVGGGYKEVSEGGGVMQRFVRVGDHGEVSEGVGVMERFVRVGDHGEVSGVWG